MAGKRAVTGGCHCGAVTFEAEVDLERCMVCNCSHCHAKGFVLTFVPRDRFRLLSGEDGLGEYRFNTKQLEHRFCQTCGVQPFAFGTAPDGSGIAAINLRCVDGVDLVALNPEHFDGRSA